MKDSTSEINQNIILNNKSVFSNKLDYIEEYSCKLKILKESRQSLFAKISLYLILLYQKFLSPYIGKGCKYQPTCSNYTYEAIFKYGFFKGWVLGLYRILRCNPFSKGGYDPVP